MPRTTRRARRARGTVRAADGILDTSADATVLDMLDSLLNKGVVLNGDVVLGVAGVDLIYLRLSSLLCAVDRIMSRDQPARLPRRRRPLDKG